ncbi:unnamed protein product [Protopolystoma xenopodis]|uniref:Glycogen debranching enzyme central domain-containing protein n=1 Tax=Protopolystoma xenopodis TaxID=117903 RepID=A0A3S5FCL5_9PLAT|nr:unnamed protein product [Protopolystoma xenopodis]
MVLVAHTAFSDPGASPCHRYVRPLDLNGRAKRIALEANVVCQTPGGRHPREIYCQKKEFINGMETLVCCQCRKDVEPFESQMVHFERHEAKDTMHFDFFPPGSVIVVFTCLDDEQSLALQQLHRIVETQASHSQAQQHFGAKVRATSLYYAVFSLVDVEMLPPITCTITQSSQPPLPLLEEHALANAISQLNLFDLNWALFRAATEEAAEGSGRGPYHVPGHGDLVYCGLQVMKMWLEICYGIFLSHHKPHCTNIYLYFMLM